MNNTDTPQPQTANTGTSIDAFGGPTNNEGSDNKDNLSVEDAFFGASETKTNETPEGDIQEGQGNNAQADAPYEAKNDDKRYEYWQSQAAQRENELSAYKAQVNQAVQAQRQQVQNNQAPAQQQEFPPPPMKPDKPRSFSREEAWSDSASDSAKYLDDMDTWNDSINQYRDLRNQYDIAVVREGMEAQDERRRVAVAKRAEYNAEQSQKQGVYEHVQGHYGLTQEDAAGFVNSMSNPNSISMDNLVQLYRMNQGAPVNAPSQGPSDAFQQSKNAQQIPSPMGVMPGQAPESNRSDSDSIMDDLIKTHKSKNPWT